MTTSLLTQQDREALPELYGTEDVLPMEKVIQCKLFAPWTNWTWYVIEYDGDDLCFGLVVGFAKEFGYFNLSDLEALSSPFGLSIERDRYFKPRPVDDLMY